MTKKYFYAYLALLFLAFYYICLPLVYADDCTYNVADSSTWNWVSGGFWDYNTYSYLSTAPDRSTAAAQLTAVGYYAYTYGNVTSPSGSWMGVYLGFVDSNHNGFFDAADPDYPQYKYITYRIPSDACYQQPDADGDGMPDSQDMYPDDPSPYLVKLMLYETDDCTSTGNHVYEIWKTDRGDVYTVGSPNESCPYPTPFYPQSAWIEPAEGYVTGELSKSSMEELIIEDGLTLTPHDGTAPTDSDSTLQGGELSDGTESADEAQRGTMSNTGKIANNTKRQGEYLKDINKAVQNSYRYDLLRYEQERVRIKKEEAQAKEDAANTKAIEDMDIQEMFNTNNINGDLVEGEEGDYQDHGPLGEETWIQEFIETNPVYTVLSNSGFELKNSTCQYQFDLGRLGIHEIDLCPFEDKFILFGNLLVSLTTLVGLIHVATGNGF